MIYSIISCDNRVNDYDIFNGEIKTIDDTVTSITKLNPQEVVLDGITYGFLSVYDSLMLFYNNKLPDKYYSIFNLRTGKHIGDFCPKGQGPGDARIVSPIYCFYKENNELKTLLSLPYDFKLAVWNISKSMETNKTVWDFIPYDWRTDHIEFPHSHIARLNDNEFIGNVQTICMNPDEDCTISTLPSYEKRTIYSSTLIKKYTIYKQSLKHRYSDRLLSSHDCLKPDGTKIVQFMDKMWQINMIDIETGTVTAYRSKKNFSDFSSLSNFSEPFENLPVYFMRATSTDKYIFAVYCNGTKIGNLKDGDFVVYVFDWDCNLLKKLKLQNEFYHEFFVDEATNLLYTLNINDDGETICRYDLDSIGLWK
jgi:hypothetical protein